MDVQADDGAAARHVGDPLVTRPVVKADVDAGTITVDGIALDRYEATGLIAELAHALAAIAPPVERGWEQDPNRENLSGRIGQRGRHTRPR